MTAVRAPATSRPRAGRSARAGGGAAAAPGIAPQRDAVDAAGGRRPVLVDHLPQGHGHAAVVEPARRKPAERCPGGFRIAGCRRGRVDGVAGRPPPHHRAGDDHRPVAMGPPARHLGRHHRLGNGGLPGLCGSPVRGNRAPGQLGRAAVVAGRGRAPRACRSSPRSGSPPGRSSPAGSPHRWPPSPRFSRSRSVPSRSTAASRTGRSRRWSPAPGTSGRTRASGPSTTTSLTCPSPR